MVEICGLIVAVGVAAAMWHCLTAEKRIRAEYDKREAALKDAQDKRVGNLLDILMEPDFRTRKAVEERSRRTELNAKLEEGRIEKGVPVEKKQEEFPQVGMSGM